MDRGQWKDEIVRLSGLAERIDKKRQEVDTQLEALLNSTKPQTDRVIQLGGLLDRLNKKQDEVRNQIKHLISRSDTTELDVETETLLAEDSGGNGDSGITPTRTPRKKRKSKFPEGPPLNRQVLEFLREAKGTCGHQDVGEVVEAHPQSIQNSLRDLERRGYAVKLGPNQWMASEDRISKGDLTIVN